MIRIGHLTTAYHSAVLLIGTRKCFEQGVHRGWVTHAPESLHCLYSYSRYGVLQRGNQFRSGSVTAKDAQDMGGSLSYTRPLITHARQ